MRTSTAVLLALLGSAACNAGAHPTDETTAAGALANRVMAAPHDPTIARGHAQSALVATATTLSVTSAASAQGTPNGDEGEPAPSEPAPSEPAPSEPAPTEPAPLGYKVGGTVSGLVGTLVLTNINNGDELSVTSNGAFELTTRVESGDYYDVRIFAQPAGQHCRVEAGGDIIDGGDANGVIVTCATVECVNLGWKLGGDDWSCPAGYRMPTTMELARVAPCFDPVDEGRFSAWADVAVSVGGCGCGWNPSFCDVPSVQTMRMGQACGDYAQLHVCVAE